MPRPKLVVIDHCPVPEELAELVSCLKRDVPGAVLASAYRGQDAKALLHANGKHTQQECVDLHAQGVPGFGPANPADRGSHLLLGDGTFGKLHAPLKPQQCGMDWGDRDIPALIKAAAARGWTLKRPYASGSEYHHLNAFVWPAMGAVLGMAKGSKRASVEILTRRLAFVGYPCPQGQSFDDRVDAAVRKFQRDHDLTADGKVGPQTWTVLDHSVAKHKRAAAGPPPPPKKKPQPKPAPKPAPTRRATHVSNAGLTLIAGFEGFVAHAYKPVAAERYFTVGFGHFGSDVKPGMVVTRTRALELLRHDAATAEATVRRLVRVGLNQHRFDALVSFVFNAGGGNFESSTLLKLLNRGDYRGASAQFGRWTYGAGGQHLEGLVKRRAAERALFDRPVSR